MTLPKVVFGTSGLGNLFTALEETTKEAIVRECLVHSPAPVVFDTAGKYGAGLALEALGAGLRKANAAPEKVLISNKLGWLRVPLTTPEPTFEPGVWKNLHYDAVQRISYDGILECFEQGNSLLGNYTAQMVSVHDPDEYLAKARDKQEEEQLLADIMGAYQALRELKLSGRVQSVGIGAKNWRVIERISGKVALDWVMIANSFTIKTHPRALHTFLEQLQQQGVQVINSAVFHSGFLTGGNYYDYQLINAADETHQQHLKWREEFFSVCNAHAVQPAAACVQFALKAPGVMSIALNTTHPQRVAENLGLANAPIPSAFWEEMKEKQLINSPGEATVHY